MPKIRWQCEHCKRTLHVGQKLFGSKIACPNCRSTIVLPTSPSQSGENSPFNLPPKPETDSIYLEPAPKFGPIAPPATFSSELENPFDFSSETVSEKVQPKPTPNPKREPESKPAKQESKSRSNADFVNPFSFSDMDISLPEGSVATQKPAPAPLVEPISSLETTTEVFAQTAHDSLKDQSGKDTVQQALKKRRRLSPVTLIAFTWAILATAGAVYFALNGPFQKQPKNNEPRKIIEPTAAKNTSSTEQQPPKSSEQRKGIEPAQNKNTPPTDKSDKGDPKSDKNDQMPDKKGDEKSDKMDDQKSDKKDDKSGQKSDKDDEKK